jgi:YD repeat-containing protein
MWDGNNRITTPGYRYDAAGNLLMDNLNCYTYDAENRLSSVAQETSPGSDVCGATVMSYLYGPDGRRVAKVNNGQIVKQFYYDPAGNLTTDNSSVPPHTFQYDAEGRMSSVDNGSTAAYTYNALGQPDFDLDGTPGLIPLYFSLQLPGGLRRSLVECGTKGQSKFEGVA